MPVRANAVSGSLTEPMGPTSTTMVAEGLMDLPVIAGSDFAKVTVYRRNSEGRVTAREIVHVTAHESGSMTATVQRAREGTTAGDWVAGDRWDHAFTAADLNGLQPLDSDLSAIAALSTTEFGRSLLTQASAGAARTTLDVPSNATLASEIATRQPLDSDLMAIAALATTAFGRGLLTLADAAAGRTALGAVWTSDRLDTDTYRALLTPHGDTVRMVDAFDRPDAALGTSDSGHAWTVPSGTVSVASGKASGAAGYAVRDMGAANVDLTMGADPYSSASQRMVFRWVDVDNHLYLHIDNTGVRVRRIVAGTVGNITGYAGGGNTGVVGLTVRARIDGDNLKVWREGVLIHDITLNEADAATFADQTSHGFYVTSAARIAYYVGRSLAESVADPVQVETAITGIRGQVHRDARRIEYIGAQEHTGSTATVTIETFGFTYPSGTRFRGAVVAPDGVVYVIPRDSGFFVLLHPDGTVEDSDLGLTTQELEEMNVSGGCVGPDGNIYSPPRDSDKVLIINTRTRTASLDDWGVDLSTIEGGGTSELNKWTGGVLGPDGRIYFLSTSARNVLVLDVLAQKAWRTDYGLTWSGGRLWIGGCLAPNGRIYCPPYNGNDGALIIDPLTQTAEINNLGLSLSGTAKWSGIAYGADGRLYGCPRQADKVLIIDPFTDTAELKDYGLSLPLGDNKWTRFVPGPDGKLYGTPADYTDLLVVDPIAQTAVRTDFGTTISGAIEKYIGGVQAPDGRLICSPDKASDFLLIDVFRADGTTPVPPLPPELVLSPFLNKSP